MVPLLHCCLWLYIQYSFDVEHNSMQAKSLIPSKTRAVEFDKVDNYPFADCQETGGQGY